MPASTSAKDSHKSGGRLGVNPRRVHVKDEMRKRVRTACNSCNGRRIKCSGSTPCDQCASAQRACVYPTDKKVHVLQSMMDAYESILSEFIPDPAKRQRLLEQTQHSLSTGGAACTTPIKDEDIPYSTSPAASVSTVALSPPYEAVQQQYQLASSYTVEPPARKLIGGGMDAAATEGSLLQDRDGTKRWLGGTSGATFLDHLKKFMDTLKSSLGYSLAPTDTSPGVHFLASSGQYQTSDSRLLFTPTAQDGAAASYNPFAAPGGWDAARSRLARVNEYMQDCMGAWACGGIHYFGDLSVQGWAAAQQSAGVNNNNNNSGSGGNSTSTSSNGGGSSNSGTAPSRQLGFYEAAFALGTVYSLTAANSRRDGQLGEMSFAKARRIVGDLADTRHGMGDVATLALMATYMAEMNRRDSAYMHLSHALTICCMSGGLKSFSSETEKRIVWTLFCLEKDASCLMGRPPLYPDEAFQLPYPTHVPGLPPPDGLIAHVELCKIAGYIVSNTYSIAPRETVPRSRDPVEQVSEPLRMLDEWRANLPANLQIPLELPPEAQIPLDDAPPEESLPADRALCMLHMKWNQLLILSLRPLFFLAVKSSVGGDFLNSPRDMLDHPGIEPIMKCSAAARRNLRLGRHIYERCHPPAADGLQQQQQEPQQQPNKLVMLDLHHIFNAAVVLLLHQMVFSNVVNTDTMGIRGARAIFEKEARTECPSPGNNNNNKNSGGVKGGSPTGYASDCLAVLNDLTALVARIRPLRFKGSEHAATGVDLAMGGWRSPLSSTSQQPQQQHQQQQQQQQQQPPPPPPPQQQQQPQHGKEVQQHVQHAHNHHGPHHYHQHQQPQQQQHHHHHHQHQQHQHQQHQQHQHHPSSGSDAGDSTVYSAASVLGGSPVMISDEQIAANLSRVNPSGPHSLYGPLPMGFLAGHGQMAGLGVGYTNHKEMERWVQEGEQVSCGLNMQLGGYMGM